MDTAILEKEYTPDELLALENGQRFELIDGRLKEKPPMGAEANLVATALASLLYAHASSSKRGHVFTQDCGYQIFSADPKKVRKPDVSFIPRGRLPGERIPGGHVRVPPDLIVEVVSPNDLANDLEPRVADYLAVGVKLIWVIYPITRSLYVIRQDGTAARLTQGQDLHGENVLPDFTCRIDELFADLGPQP
jgi:Uma2 family endonuclease